MLSKNKLKCSHCKKQNVVLILNSKIVRKGKLFQYYVCRKCNTNRAKAYRKTKSGKKIAFKAVYASIKKYPEKARARAKLNYALRTGKITKSPCRCGKIKSEAHHSDYSKPLQVIWLCRTCHSNLHRKLKTSIM